MSRKKTVNICFRILSFENLHIRAKVNGFLEEAIQNVQVNNVVVEELP